MATGQAITKEQQVRSRLGEMLRGLEQVEAVISVAVAALKYQDCERDADVARVLQRNAGDRLAVEIERISTLLPALSAEPAQQNAGTVPP